MKTIIFKTHVGEDSILRVSLPPEIKNTDLEVTLVFQSIASEEKLVKMAYKGWQKGFFKEVIGGWEGEELVRENQPDYEQREELL